MNDRESNQNLRTRQHGHVASGLSPTILDHHRIESPAAENLRPIEGLGFKLMSRVSESES